MVLSTFLLNLFLNKTIGRWVCRLNAERMLQVCMLKPGKCGILKLFHAIPKQNADWITYM